jgi:hypothetical protein
VARRYGIDQRLLRPWRQELTETAPTFATVQIRWEAPCRFLDEGRIEFDNNTVECNERLLGAPFRLRAHPKSQQLYYLVRSEPMQRLTEQIDISVTRSSSTGTTGPGRAKHCQDSSGAH